MKEGIPKNFDTTEKKPAEKHKGAETNISTHANPYIKELEEKINRGKKHNDPRIKKLENKRARLITSDILGTLANPEFLTIKRSNGKIEGGWELTDINENGNIVVQKMGTKEDGEFAGKLMEKEVSADEIKELNPIKESLKTTDEEKPEGQDNFTASPDKKNFMSQAKNWYNKIGKTGKKLFFTLAVTGTVLASSGDNSALAAEKNTDKKSEEATPTTEKNNGQNTEPNNNKSAYETRYQHNPLSKFDLTYLDSIFRADSSDKILNDILNAITSGQLDAQKFAKYYTKKTEKILTAQDTDALKEIFDALTQTPMTQTDIDSTANTYNIEKSDWLNATTKKLRETRLKAAQDKIKALIDEMTKK